MMSSPLILSAREIAAQIRRKEVSPVEVARAHLDRIERLNPKLNAFVDYRPEVVLVQARDAGKAILRGGHIAAQDAPLVARLRAAGAVILGVTNAPELLMAWETDNLLYGRTNNPWDLTRTAG